MSKNQKPQITIHFSTIFLLRMIRKARKRQMPLCDYIWQLVLNIVALSPFLPSCAITLEYLPGKAGQGVKIRIHGVVVLAIGEVAEFYNQGAVEFLREQSIYESMRP